MSAGTTSTSSTGFTFDQDWLNELIEGYSATPGSVERARQRYYIILWSLGQNDDWDPIAMCFRYTVYKERQHPESTNPRDWFPNCPDERERLDPCSTRLHDPVYPDPRLAPPPILEHDPPRIGRSFRLLWGHTGMSFLGSIPRPAPSGLTTAQMETISTAPAWRCSARCLEPGVPDQIAGGWVPPGLEGRLRPELPGRG